MRSPRIATACAMLKRSSTVMILPLVRMVSTAACCPCRMAAAATTRSTPIAGVLESVVPSVFPSECRIRPAFLTIARTPGAFVTFEVLVDQIRRDSNDDEHAEGNESDGCSQRHECGLCGMKLERISDERQHAAEVHDADREKQRRR